MQDRRRVPLEAKKSGMKLAFKTEERWGLAKGGNDPLETAGHRTERGEDAALIEAIGK
jgi:hypothetical protein